MRACLFLNKKYIEHMSTHHTGDHKSGIDWDEWGGFISFLAFIIFILVISFWSNITSVIAGNGWDTQIASSCKDVTTYDQNWNNDMLCTRSDGSTFYTDYEGARQAEAKFKQSSSDGADSVSTSSSSDTIPIKASANETKSSAICKDVTTHDYNWDNDMLCTKPDGSTFYTSYEGARQAEAN
jgi:hypothetical protein